MKGTLATVTPSLTAAPTSLTGFTYIVGNGPSANQSFNLSGSNLTAASAITITAPTDYEVSLTTLSTDFGATATIANTAGGTLGNTNIYVRLKAGLAVGNYNSETVAVTGGGTSAPTNVTVSGSVTAAPTPTITVSTAALTAFTTTEGTASGAQTYTVSGANLNGTDGITVTPPAGYEIGQGATPTYSSSAIVVAQTSAGTVANTTISVRLAATATTGGSPYTGDIAHTSTNATTVNKAVTGTVTAPVPTVSVSTNSLAAFATTTGTPSAPSTYTVGGANLTADILVTAPAGYEVSLASASGFGPSLTLAQAGGTVAITTIYVRLTGGAAGSPSGNVTNVSGSASQNVAVTGTVTTPAPPSVANYNLTTVTANAGSAPATSVATNATATAITRGAGVGTVGTGTGLFGNNGWSSANLTAAQNNDDYITFSISPNTGYQATVSSVTINAYRTTAGPQTLELLVSTDASFATGYTSLGTQGITTNSTTPTLLTFTPSSTLSTVSQLYFRLYGYVSSNGNMYLAQSGATDGVVVYGTVAAVTTPTLYTGAVSPTPACAGSNITVNYTTAGPAATGTFSVQLSDATGSFATPVALATASSTATSITATIAGATASGTGYRVRVVNSDGSIGTVSSAFAVQNASVSIAPIATQNLNTGVNGATLTATETPAALSRQWFVSTTSGSGYTAIAGATGLTYVPNFTTPNTYYVVVQSVYSSCGTLTSNEVQIDVTTPTLTATPTSLAGFSTTLGSASLAQTYALTGTGLVSPTTVTAPAGYEVSLDGLTYSASVVATAAAVSGGAGQTVYVRLTGTSQGTVSGNVTNVVGSTSASVAVSGSVLVAPGLLLAEDDFDYTGNLNANGWTGTATSATITGNITDAMYPKGILALGGTSYKAQVLGSSGNAIYRAVTVPIGATALYAAALINVSSVQNITGSDYIFSFRTSGTTSFRGHVVIARVPSSTPARYTYKLAAGNETPISETTPTEFSLNTDQLMVLKVENSAATGNADKFSLYVLPAGSNLSQEPGTPMITVTLGNTFSVINSFSIRQSDTNNPNFTLDNFRMGTGWGVVVGNPAYAAAAATVNAGSYYNVTVNSGSQATQSGAVTVENQLALTDGKLDLNGQLLTLAGSVSGNGFLAGSATSRLTVLGTGALGTLSFAPGAQTLNNLTLNRTTNGSAVLGSPLTVNGAFALTNGIITTTATNLLSLGSAASLSGGSASSFVNGPMARATAAGARATLFPIGSGTIYRPLTLTASTQTGIATYTASQTELNTGRVLATGGALPDLTRVSTKRFYTVTTSNPGSGFTGNITLTFGSDDYVNNPGNAALVIAKRDGGTSGAWTNIGRAATNASTGPDNGPGGAPSAGTLTSGEFSGFSDFTFGATDDNSQVNFFQSINPLPVELSRFGAQRQADNAVAVTWTTATEKNAERFEVQRSRNARDFETVATAKAQGTSSKATAYALLDKSAPAGLLYYRLRQVDNDGTAAFSPVVTVAGSGETTKLLLYPNPASTAISFLAEAATPYRVLNQLGQVLLQGTTEAGTAKVAVDKLPSGLYLLELQTPAGRSVQKFEKQ
ncbi:T9SS type A sorting domain-containing protein [Hymenobacter sp. 5317J-9]|uniref:beta strand repeat-containing protein n=1 Tax=Hymenobacter sp. 5317J-9 TaxID=2932250 RepID=UPI001FD6A842|nr:T9SS type A sorting domain-containing protein [Hymenobacter sp. 5317J-9]UOQ96397.1 T9SS type A sorting domain-containing protein [Hymenobacter sp. 5317J-9]